MQRRRALDSLENSTSFASMKIMNQMPLVTIVCGALLEAMGFFAYFGADFLGEKQSVTALIPAFFGTPMMVCGVLAMNPKFLKHAMHGAAMLGLLGAVGAIFRPVKLLVTGQFELTVPFYFQAGMFALCTVFVLLCVKSFIEARQARQAVGELR